MTFLLIDTSYFIFFRYFATRTWYNFSNPGDKFDKDYIWSKNKIFVDKFVEKFILSLENLKKKHNINNNLNIIFCKDCPRKDIWRNKYLDCYKGSRTNENTDIIKDFFSIVYNEIFPILKKNDYNFINNDRLEADDLIYLTKLYIREKKKIESKIVIISSDSDLLQLIDKNTLIIDLKDKLVNLKSSGDPKIDLEMKIICGDKSDNISSCFKNCGEKTVKKLINNKMELLSKFKLNPNSFDIYARNKILIDFSQIPNNFKEETYNILDKILEI